MLAHDLSSTRPFPWLGLLLMTAAIFFTITSEFLPTGLLPDMAHSLEVSESQVGVLVSVFAGVVVLSTTPLAALTRRVRRKRLMLIVLVVFTLANVLAALAADYTMLVVARVIGGLAHGLFWAVMGAYAAHLVPRHQLARAVAVTGAGGTLAGVLGVPLGTALGHAVGWRWTFGAIAVAVALLMVLIARFLPPVDHRVPLATGEIPLPLRRDATLPAVLTLCVIIAVTMAAHNAFSTYQAPFYIAAGFDPGAVGALLFLGGGGGAIGLLLTGVLGDRYPRALLTACFSLVAVSVLVLALFPTVHWLALVAIAVWGVAFGGTPSLLQTRMLHTASPRMRDLGSALFTTSFNLAIGSGALLGAFVLDSAGVGATPFVLVGLTMVGVAFIVVTDLRRSARRTAAVPA